MTKQVVDQFAEAGFELFLHGSRSKIPYPKNYNYDEWFWVELNKRITHETDWDYAVQTSPEVLLYLLLNGYVEKADLAYRDTMTERVFEKILEDGSKIQVTTRYNLEEFKDLWRAIPTYLYKELLWKRGPRGLSSEEICTNIEYLRVFRIDLLNQNKLYTDDQIWE